MMKKIILSAALGFILLFPCFAQEDDFSDPKFSAGDVTFYLKSGRPLVYEELRVIADAWAQNPGFISLVIRNTSEHEMGIQFVYLVQDDVSFQSIIHALTGETGYQVHYDVFNFYPDADDRKHIIKQEKLSQ